MRSSTAQVHQRTAVQQRTMSLHRRRAPIDRGRAIPHVGATTHDLDSIQRRRAEALLRIAGPGDQLLTPASFIAVETLEQLHVLQSLGCDHAPGFLFARPIPTDEIGQAGPDRRDRRRHRAASARIRADHAPSPDGAPPRRLRLASEG